MTLAACDSTGSGEPAASDASRRNGGAAPSTSAPPTTAPTPTTTAPAAPPPTTAPAYEAVVSAIDDGIRSRMTSSWRPGCPVPIEDLRFVALDHWGYDGVEHRGELVVHRDHADALVRVFLALFIMRFPIERVELVDTFAGDDAASTRANNTAAFNCRSVVGRPGVWSEHAYGRAIDVNPLVNPYTLDPNLGDPSLARFLDRAQDARGMIRAGDGVVQAFAAEGWQWGGAWSSPDYQHFSATGH